MERWEAEYQVCNEFAVAYKEENPHAEICWGFHEGNDDWHAYIYDPELDVTLDPTQSQFNAYNPCEYVNDWYIGDNHPHVEEQGRVETEAELWEAM